ncbi:hypothetical protein RFI_32596 [Reticulomyxa filosa]|uniref:Uncharacterized protein n=1 Tax=Reticulomyxa filosa TaxID=46433 RepID=X6LT22_RETFI|nr:hypothetical protein RFI_32596 [Reticulomyxa filosa]|eukprot:ETO04799.1 hypothetical protein RFI_32596 [Reticulomyxa filosa]
MMHISPPPWLKPHLIDSWFDAANKGDVGILRTCIDEGIHIDYFHNESHETALIVSAKRNHVNSAQYLLGLHCNKDASDIHNRTAIHYAGINLNSDVFRLLAQHGSSLKARDNDFRSAVDYVIEGIGLKVIKQSIHNKDKEKSNTLGPSLPSGPSKMSFFICKGSVLSNGNGDPNDFYSHLRKGSSVLSNMVSFRSERFHGLFNHKSLRLGVPYHFFFKIKKNYVLNQSNL